MRGSKHHIFVVRKQAFVGDIQVDIFKSHSGEHVHLCEKVRIVCQKWWLGNL